MSWLLVLALPCAAQTVFEALPASGLVPAVPVEAGLPAAPAQPTELETFLADFHKDLIRERPDLYRKKLKLAASDDFHFSRVFPQLFYRALKESAEAAKLARAPEVFLDGDVHIENVQIESSGGREAPQFNDFDDGGEGPSSLDVARLLVNSALAAPEDKRDAAAAEARKGYETGLGSTFPAWAKSLENEKAVSKAKARDRDWPKHASVPVKDKALAASLRRAAGLDDEWKVFDRKGAGGSSIGVRRYMFVHPEHGHVWELKELRGPAIEYFTGRAPAESDADRVAKAWRVLRQVPGQVRTLSHDGADWSLRRREAEETSLSADHPLSAARAVGGALGQAHRGQASEAALRAAAADVTDALVRSTIQRIADWRRELLTILGR